MCTMHMAWDLQTRLVTCTVIDTTGSSQPNRQSASDGVMIIIISVDMWMTAAGGGASKRARREVCAGLAAPRRWGCSR